MDRKDGIKVKNKNGMFALMTFLMPKRVGSDVYINTKIDVTNLVEYYNELKSKKEYEHLTYFHLFSMAAGKLFYNKKLLNRFVINHNFYDRKFVSLSFVAKKEFKDNSEELFSVVKVEKNDNIFTLSDKISSKVKGVRSEKTNSADDFIDKIGNTPKFIRWFMIKVLKILDNHDLIPESLTSNSIYHSSLLMSNLGSINCDGAIFHHLTDFGTNSIIMTIGKIKEEPIVIDGKIEIRKVCEFGFNIDERIADGFYFIRCLELFEYILNNPTLLENRADEKINIEK